MTTGVSPLSTGPAGPLFEGQVAAYYFLALLIDAPPRGLPGTVIDKVALQRAGEGYALDDVVVHAHDHVGAPATLEIQVKRDIAFSPQDAEFHSVIQQISRTIQKPEFFQSRYELAVATALVSKNINGHYQDVLTWARQIGDSATFINRVNRAGVGSAAKRAFVETFRIKLTEAGAAVDDRLIWEILRRFQILHFDFTATSSVSEEVVRDRAAAALDPREASRAAELWSVLTNLALQTAAAGGDRTWDTLLADLGVYAFRLAERRNCRPTLALLKESAAHTLAEIDDQIAGAKLMREERVHAVRAALQEGRYVEIRGDGGVGKSAVMKYFAEEASAESQIIVLSPRRTQPGGWTNMRAVLSFEGTAAALLTEMALSGAGILFVDNLDFFADAERQTVIDLVREASAIPGLCVVVTARSDFGELEPSWLPSDALGRLGRTRPVVIDELSESEIAQLRIAAPSLVPLLADDHPARNVARNLFRLSRLASSSSQQASRTEAEMALHWWQTADGRYDADHRSRARALTALAGQALTRVEPLNSRDQPPAAVDALVRSGTLRDLGDDRVSFRHDVLRDWAVANLLRSDEKRIDDLPMDRPAPGSLARGVEIAARMMIESEAESAPWHSFLTALSRPTAHGSWRRMALLALVRSEIAEQSLQKAAPLLTADDANLLRELIRIVIAVEAEPVERHLANAGIDPQLIPAGLNFPKGQSWYRLIIWLAKTGTNLPTVALPEVVELYHEWSMAMFGRDPLTPALLRWFYYWLEQIQQNRLDGVPAQVRGPLVRDLIQNFLLFCDHVPDLAVQYISKLRETAKTYRGARALPKFLGALARSAPKEFAELAADILLSNEDEDERGLLGEPFGHKNLDFVPASPAQGPFLELLSASPPHGLKLVRDVVDHAIAVKSGGKAYGKNAITIRFGDGTTRVFPWVQSYNWSRDLGCSPAIVVSALMALEAWAHSRIAAGEPFDQVMNDVIGSNVTCAAFLLVAVDLLLSHWPQSSRASVPYMASPDLICMDRERALSDNMKVPDILGLGVLQREPIGLATLQQLKKRPSRRASLDGNIGWYALYGTPEERNELRSLLQEASLALGPPKSTDDLSDPAFMVIHALNLLDEKNWQKRMVQHADRPVEAFEYIPPEGEEAHLKLLRAASQPRLANAGMQAQILNALNTPTGSSPEFAAAAVKWVQDIVGNQDELTEHQETMRHEATVTAAVVGLRDGTAELVTSNESWMRDTFVGALKGPHDPAQGMRVGLHFNPFAIAFCGMALLLKHRFSIGDVCHLLEAAADEDAAAARGLSYCANILDSVDERLSRAVLRTAFCARPHARRRWGTSDEDYDARRTKLREVVEQHIASELSWFEGETAEPEWPNFPTEQARPRWRSHRPKRSGDVPDEEEMYIDHHGAALWLSGATPLFDARKRPWLMDITRSYATWTCSANGAGFQRHEDVDHAPLEWNDAYFRVVAACLVNMEENYLREQVIAPIVGLPDRSFCDVVATLIRSTDAVYFSDFTLDHGRAVQLRTEFAKRLMDTGSWIRHTEEHSERIETHLGPAIATLLFNNYNMFSGASCYLLPNGIELLDSYLAVLQQLAANGTFLFVANVFLNVFEVGPRSSDLPTIVGAAQAWLVAQPESHAFWADYKIGSRLCAIIERIPEKDMRIFENGPIRENLNHLLAALVRLGVPDAHRLEESLR